VSGVDVVDGGALGDAEDADQVDRVGGVAGLVQDAVLPQSVRADGGRLEHDPDHGRADRARVNGGLLADQQVRVAAAGPALVPVPQPLAGQGGGDLIEVDDPVPVTPPDGRRACGQIGIYGAVAAKN
jgi:hypothetical protein